MLTDSERELVFTLAQKLTGAHPDGTYRPEIFLTNIEKRIREKNARGLMDYLRLANADPDEYAHLISSLSIHTTSWFRENPHFVIFQQILLKALEKRETFRVWCTACSTGEEVYSFALMLEEFRRINPTFDYRILGTDIDPLCVETGKRAIYTKRSLTGPLSYYKSHILLGSGKSEDYFTFTKEVRERCEFQVQDIREPLPGTQNYHIVVCRNVLIYFSQGTIDRVLKTILTRLIDGGHLILGHSEIIPHADYSLTLKGHSVYMKGRPALKVVPEPSVESKVQPPNGLHAAMKSGVLIVDDSRLAREALKQKIVQAGIEPLMAATINEAEAILREKRPSLILLDLNMPDRNGEDWLKELRWKGFKTPIVIVSSVHPSKAPAVVKLLEEGAQAYLEKDEFRQNPDSLINIIEQIIQTNQDRKPEKTFDNLPKKRPSLEFKPEAILVGASTGGPMAVALILKDLPPWTPPVVMVQHISAKFALPFADRIADISGLRLGEIKDGTKLQKGCFYLVQEDAHLSIRQSAESDLILGIDRSAPMNGHRPSVDFLFYSACEVKKPMMAMLLTGMGKDGAVGLDSLHQRGVYTIAQSEEDCIVFGMPKEAIRRNAADFVGNCGEIHGLLKDILLRMAPGGQLLTVNT